MYTGHYGVALAAKRVDSRIPLWQLFIAVQFLDVLWSAFNIIGVERSSIYPGGGASKLTFTYLPWTHGLLSSLGWSVLIFLIFLAWPAPKGSSRWVVAIVLGAAVWSHFWLDLPTHRPDLPLIGDSFKVGLGLYSSQIGTFIAETATLVVGLWLYLTATRDRGIRHAIAAIGFVLGLVAINTLAIFGPPFGSVQAVALFLEASYIVFAAIAFLVDRQPKHQAIDIGLDSRSVRRERESVASR